MYFQYILYNTDIFIYTEPKIHDNFLLFLYFAATASQQEPEAESSSDPTLKASGLSPAAQTLPPAAAASAGAEKSVSPPSVDKNKDTAAVTVT